VNAFTDPRFVEPTRRRTAALAAMGEIDDTMPTPGNYAYQPVPGSPEYWHVSRQPEAATGVGLPRVRGLLVLQEFNGEPIGVATDATAFVPLSVSTGDHIAQMFAAILRRRFAR
jgi:hypothetical protein